MTEPDLVGLFVTPLEGLGLDYMITGGVASVIYGDPRFTRDIDLVLGLKEEDADSLLDAFSPDDFYRPSLDVLKEEIRRPRYGHFKIIHRDTALRADVYLLGDDPLHAWAFERRVRIPLEGDTAIWLAPPEYVVVRKLQYYQESGSDRHLQDVSAMLEISRDKINVQEVEIWTGRGLTAASSVVSSVSQEEEPHRPGSSARPSLSVSGGAAPAVGRARPSCRWAKRENPRSLDSSARESRRFGVALTVIPLPSQGR